MNTIYTIRTLSIVAFAMLVALRNGCSAFGSRPARISGFRPTHRTQPFQRNVRLHVSASLPQDQGALFSAADLFERELKGALDFARDIDKKYGLCTEPSREAWSRVDDVYRKIQSLREDAERTEAVQETQTQQRSVVRRRQVVTDGISIEGETTGRRYFF